MDGEDWGLWLRLKERMKTHGIVKAMIKSVPEYASIFG
jgi:hypothetical protein